MSRRRWNRYNEQGGNPPPAKPVYRAPVWSYKARPYTRPVDPYLYPPPRAPKALDHPARRSPHRTVRPLIRTVLTDTRSATRSGLDVSRRAANRSRKRPRVWSTARQVFAPGYWLEKIPLYRSMVCAKRSIRREVLMALGLTSKGAGASSRRYDDESKMRC